MKALEKAAKDRDEARADPAGEAPATEPAWVTASQSPPEAAEPTTMPGAPGESSPPTMPGARSEFSTAPAPGARSEFSTAPAPAGRSELSLEPIVPPTEPSMASPPPPRPEARPAATTRSRVVANAREQQQARAATVMQASGSAPGAGAVAFLMARPVSLIGVIATLIGIGYGIYVYLQLFHPALFLPKPPMAPKAVPVPASPLAQTQAPAPAPIPGTGTVAGTPVATAPAAPTTPGFPPSLPPVMQAATPEAAPTPPSPAPASGGSRIAEKSAAEAKSAAPTPAPRDAIVVTRSSSAAPTVSPALRDAYVALRADRRDDAQRAYEQLLRTEPRNIDALLGLASIATAEGRRDDAARRYMQILELDPRNALAQAGLIGLLGRADPVAAESQLKQLIAREPSGYLHFTLGNLYADQSQWAAAQQAYFQAHHLEPTNPDYAYNLAVGLDHVSQPKLALTYYRRAVDLAATTGTARFDVAQAQQRISRLASQAE